MYRRNDARERTDVSFTSILSVHRLLQHMLEVQYQWERKPKPITWQTKAMM
jgi:uncharacterized damage-inducible protein DinB